MTTETKNKFFSFLKENGLKPTSQRNLVVKQLLNGKDRHFTAEALYDEMRVKKTNISFQLFIILFIVLWKKRF